MVSTHIVFKKEHPNQKGGCPNTLDTPWIHHCSLDLSKNHVSGTPPQSAAETAVSYQQPLCRWSTDQRYDDCNASLNWAVKRGCSRNAGIENAGPAKSEGKPERGRNMKLKERCERF